VAHRGPLARSFRPGKAKPLSGVTARARERVTWIVT